MNEVNVDLKYYERAASKRFKKLKSQATNGSVRVSKQIEKVVKQETISKKIEVKPESNGSSHFSLSINAILNAPVIIIPENIFQKSSQIEFHLGVAMAKSNLQNYDPEIKYKEI